MAQEQHFDVAIIGAGLSALAAGIRLAHFGRKVCLFERHNAVGGLNSIYSIDGRKFDVGLHAITNFVPRDRRSSPLNRILRQLRIEREALDLCPQLRSVVRFPDVELAFTNDFAVLETAVATVFPAQIDGFRRLVTEIRAFDDTTFAPPALGARELIRRHVGDRTLEDLLLCPMLYYGSAQEGDMEAIQFVIMFKSIFLEGLARPFDGIRVLLRLLTERLRECGGERRMKCGVVRIRTAGERVTALDLENGDTVTANIVLSSAGAVETARLCGAAEAATESQVGRLSFVETIQVLRRQPRDFGWTETIVFFSDRPRFDYSRPSIPVDVHSGVICLPSNFDFGGRTPAEGGVRTTCLANFSQWSAMPAEQYQQEKARWFGEIETSARRFLAPVEAAAIESAKVATDMFTPTTVRRYTGHLGGAIYGAPTKSRDGRTAFSNLFLIGTDQGFLGITGSMLSGITMANLHVLQAE